MKSILIESKRRCFKIQLLYLIFFPCVAISQTPADDQNWDLSTLQLNEDFTGSTLNSSLWQNGLGWDDSNNCSFKISAITYTSSIAEITVDLGTNATDHGLVTNDKVAFFGILGLSPNINGTAYTVTVTANNKFTIPVASLSGTYTASSGCMVQDNYFYGNTSNVYLDGSTNLILKADYNSSRTNGKYIHSGAITSTSNYDYGYYEIKCKLNSNGTRLMPAFWLFRSQNPACSTYWYNELDFFEAYQENGASTDFNITSNYHWQVGETSCGGIEYNSFADNIKTGVDVSTVYHVYGYEWTPQKLICYFDGVPYRYLVSDHVPNHTMLMTVDLGIKNPWTAAPNGLGTNSPNYENYMTIDYIKVYSLKKNCTPQTITGFNSGTTPASSYSLRQSITINGTSVVQSTDKVTFRAEQGIEISGDFTATSGCELTLLPTNCY